MYCAVTFVFAGGLASLTVRLQLSWSLTSADACDPLGSWTRPAGDEAAMGVWPLHPKAAVRLKPMRSIPLIVPNFVPNFLRCCRCHMSLRLSVFGLGSGVSFRLSGDALVRPTLKIVKRGLTTFKVTAVHDAPRNGLHAIVP